MLDDCMCACYLTSHNYLSLVEGESQGGGKTAVVLAPRLAVVFRWLWVAFLFAVEWLMSPEFQRVHLPPQH